MRRFHSLFLSFILLATSLQGVIIPVSTIEHLYDEMSAYDENTLVIFDVDDTLITPEDVILRPKGRYLRRHIISTLSQSNQRQFLEKKDYITSSVLLQRKIQLIESFTPHLITALQQKGVKVIALTAISGGRLGLIPSIEDWRLQELAQLNYNFEGVFDSPISFKELSDLPPLKVYGNEVLNTSPPVYKNGIIFSGITPKGNALREFLELVNWKPQLVVFVDDHLLFLESVEKNMRVLGIDFIGYHYDAAERLPGELDETIGKIQFNYVMQTGLWLTDEEARAMR